MLFEPESILMLIKKCAVFLHAYIKEFRKAGANGIVMAEPAAGLLSPDQCDEFSSAFIREIVKDVQDENFLYILHNCGNTGHVTKSMVSTGARALHFGNKIDISRVLEEVPQNIIVMGNIDPAGIFRMAPPEQVGKISAELLTVTRKYRNYVISSGCEIPPGVRKENFKAFFYTVEKFNLVSASSLDSR
jgi:uroporphyrinogen decarboxylase